jgi:predicted AlkP superfamily phosphohydrolase/phosphomutase
VWLNVRGRDPQGLVEPGAEYDRIRRQIRETFMALRDAQTGEPIIEAVHFREEIYNGPFVEQAPDVLILFRDVVVNGIPVNGKVLKLPPPTIAVPRDIKSGSHRPQGVVMLSGAGVKQGAELKDANLLDIAPTVMYLMGQPVSRSMDGQVLAQAFTPDHLLANPVKMTDASTGTPGPADPGYTSDEATVIMERLRGLGYVD